MESSAESLPTVAALFGELAELSPVEQAMRLGALDESNPALARELRALLEVDAGARDFFGIFTPMPGVVQAIKKPSASASTATPSDAPSIGPYRLVREIGRGGMGTVWLAHDDRLDRALALKFLRMPDVALNDESASARATMRARFIVEARAAAGLDHPHVASVYDVGGASDGQLYIAMAYCAGGSLAQLLQHGPLAPADVARIGAQIAAALSAAHARGVVHRDVKPANVLFDASGNVRLADFGIASLPGHDATRTGMVAGTLAYLAPEQLRGERADFRADLWALGATLYEALTKRRAFHGDSPASVMHAVLHGTPTAVDRLTPNVPPSMVSLIEQLLHKDPGARPASAERVEQLLRTLDLREAGHERRASDRENDRSSARERARASDRAVVSPAPVQLTAFVGRVRELADVMDELRHSRLLTLTGAGGSGKTRLAAAVVERQLTDGLANTDPAGTAVLETAWVDLAPLADASLVATQIAAALRVPERADKERLDAVIDMLADASLLLVLDNCEHVVDAAANAVDAILRGCPAVRIIATSREALGVAGERAWLVPAMQLTDAQDLFEQRAKASRADFAITEQNRAAVQEICARLDGIPLALELAAARVRSLTPEQIAARLDGAFQLLTSGSRTALPRHRTLRGTMEWSHALLSPRDRTLLRRLSVFAGGFTLPAAEAVCADEVDITTADVLDGVSSLVDKSLVLAESRGDDSRYRLLETVRQYARERLAEAGELPAIERTHAHYMTQIAERAAVELEGGEHTRGLMARLVAEHDNLRTAAQWSLHGDPLQDERGDVALRLSGALFWYWHGVAGWLGTAQFSEAHQFVRAALARGEGAPASRRGNALVTFGLIGLASGDYSGAIVAFTEALALYHEEGDARSEAWTQAWLSAALLMEGRLEESWAVSESAYSYARRVPTSMLHTVTTSWRGIAALGRGDLATARATQQENVRYGLEIGHRTSIAHAHAFLGAINLAEHRIDEAVENFTVSFPLHLELLDGWGLALDLEGLSRIAMERGQHDESVRLLGAVDAWREKVGMALPTFEVADRERRVTQAQTALGEAFASLYAEGRALSPKQAAQRVLLVREP